MVAVPTAEIPAIDSIYEGGLPVTEIFGLPVHPLVVHAAVVLIPLCSIGLIAMATGIRRSKKFGGVLSALSAAAAASAFLAMASGRDLAEELGYGPQRHFELGNWMPWVGLVVLVATLLLWLVDKKPAKRGLPGTIVAVVAIVVGLGAIGLTVWTGHLGAELTWG